MNIDFLKSKGPSAISRVLGISRQTVTNYIKGDSCMTADQALILARHYGVSLSAVVDPDYCISRHEDLVNALDAENRLLIAKLESLKMMLTVIQNDAERAITSIGSMNEQEVSA